MYAGFWKRVFAFVLDSMVFGILVLMLTLITGQMDSIKSNPQSPAALLIFLGAYLFYFVYLESSPWQATLGKKMLGIKVVDLNWQRVSFWRSLARNLSMILSNFLYIGYIMVAFTKHKQGLHDIIAGCYVVTDNAQEPSALANSKYAGSLGCFMLLLPVILIGLVLTVPELSMSNWWIIAENSRINKAKKQMKEIVKNQAVYTVSEDNPVLQNKNFAFYFTNNGARASRLHNTYKYSLWLGFQNGQVCCISEAENFNSCSTIKFQECLVVQPNKSL